jgi:hypothetical protein
VLVEGVMRKVRSTTRTLSYFVLSSVSWGCQVEGPPPPHGSCFSFLLWTSLVIHGLLANPLVLTMCRSIDHSCLLNEKRAICLILKKKQGIIMVLAEVLRYIPQIDDTMQRKDVLNHDL